VPGRARARLRPAPRGARPAGDRRDARRLPHRMGRPRRALRRALLGVRLEVELARRPAARLRRAGAARGDVRAPLRAAVPPLPDRAAPPPARAAPRLRSGAAPRRRLLRVPARCRPRARRLLRAPSARAVDRGARPLDRHVARRGGGDPMTRALPTDPLARLRAEKALQPIDAHFADWIERQDRAAPGASDARARAVGL